MKKIISTLCFTGFSLALNAQLSGIVNVPASYTSVASVLAAINQQGVSGPLTVNIAAGYTETAISGGYSLTASGTATSPIIFQRFGAGSNPLLLAYSGGSGTPGSMKQDGIWRLIGCDYVTIDGIDLLDQNATNPATMEFGFGLFKASATNGCQNNVIKNCSVTLNRINNASGSGPAADGSRGIDVVNASSNVHNSTTTVSSASGSNSNNKFYANTIRNCNIGISLNGFADIAPFAFADNGNDVGGNAISTGNAIFDFGGGGTSNSAMAIRTQAQYNLNVSYNTINNNTGAGIDHTILLKGIYLGNAVGANVTVNNNTLTLHSGSTGSQLTVIENTSGSGALSNTIAINNNVIANCSYTGSVSGPFYGIWNTASPANLTIQGNSFVNNSTSASSGSTYLIYNNGAVASSISIVQNKLGFTYNGNAAYGGGLYAIYNANGGNSVALSITNNRFSNFNHSGFTGTGAIYFVSNTNDCFTTTISNNTWHNLFLNHSGSEYLINTPSSTQSVLSVTNNSISVAYQRTAAAGAMYLCYSTGASPAACVQTFSGNIFSNITATVAGSGNFYGIYTTDGAASPYPKKNIFNNKISNITINSTGIFYGFYLDNLGDGSGSVPSSVYNNSLTLIARGGPLYGLYVTAAVSPSYTPLIYSNLIQDLGSTGASANVYGAYLAGGGAGLNFHKNKICQIAGTGTSSAVYGIYVNSAVSTTLANNFVGSCHAPNSSGANIVNGIYINAGSFLNVLYNTVYLDATSNGGNFNSNALYASSTTSLVLKNNILVNRSQGGTGVSAAFRRSSTSLTNYLSGSNNNLFYAGTPGTANVILQNGTTAYQTLSAFQTAVSPRESASVSQNLQFLNTAFTSPNYLRVIPHLASLTESGALTIAGIADDYDYDARHGSSAYIGTGSAPDIGADEYDQNLSPCITANAGSLSALSYSLCAGQTVTLISKGYTPGTGLLHQWKISATPGGSYSAVSNGLGATTPEYTSSSLAAGTYYYRLETTCSSLSVSAVSSEATVVVQPLPTASAQVNSTLVCAGQSLNLLANALPGATFQWMGPNGFNSELQNPALVNINLNHSGVYYLSTFLNGCSSLSASVAVNVSSVALTVSASSSSLCLGNSAVLSLTTSASSYTWSTGAFSNSIVVSPTITQIYTVAATNTANCIVSRSIAISVINPSIAANTAVACGSQATVNLSVNSFTPSLVNWYSSPSATNSIGSGTNYALAISSNTTLYAEAIYSSGGCQSQRIPVSATLSPNPTLSVTATPTIICPGKQSTLTVSGASSYSWTSVGSGSLRVVSPASASVYTVRGKDSYSCASTATVMIATFTVPLITVAHTATSVCPSGLVSFTASGADSYYWNNGTNGPVNHVTPGVSTNYTVYGTNTQSCTSSKTLAVITRSVPMIHISQSDTLICPGMPVTFTASGAVSYTWLPGHRVSSTFSASPLTSSVYNAIGRSSNTCTNVGIAAITVEVCTGINSDHPEVPFRIFPNPSFGFVYILGEKEVELELRIFSYSGALVKTAHIKDQEALDISELARGIYLLEIKQSNTIRYQKLVLQD